MKKKSAKKTDLPETIEVPIDFRDIGPCVISVEEKHIKKGERLESEKCPVALAIKEATGLKVRVAPAKEFEIPAKDSWSDSIKDRVIFKLTNSVIILKLPKKVALLVEEFDKTGKMKPFTFTLKL